MRPATFNIRLIAAAATLLAASLSGAAAAGVLETLFAPKARLWEYWSRHADVSESALDHSVWKSFLAEYVQRGPDGVIRVDYGAVSAARRAALKGYLEAMQAVRITSYPRPHQLAYWLNLYNAVTVDIVLDHYPVDSIRDIKLSRGFFSRGPWTKKLLRIEAKDVSLNDIEHRILRPIWKDPRIHYAVNCASLGCPNLLPVPFSADNAERLLDRAAREFVNHPRGARVEDGRLYVSSIYVWFRSDFGGSDADVIDHIRGYAEPDLAAALQDIRRISGDAYDWTLNDAP